MRLFLRLTVLILPMSCGVTDLSPPGDKGISPDVATESSMPASIRNADQLRASFSELTGVPFGAEAVGTEFADTAASLPSESSLDGAGFSTQLGIVRFAASYCHTVFISGSSNWVEMLEKRRRIVSDVERTLNTTNETVNFWNSQRGSAAIAEMLSQYWGPDRPGLGNKRQSEVSEMLTLARQLAVGENANRDVLAGLCTAALSSFQVTSL